MANGLCLVRRGTAAGGVARERAGAAAAVAGILYRLGLRLPLVHDQLLLDLPDHVSLRRAAGAGCGRHPAAVQPDHGTLLRAVRVADRVCTSCDRWWRGAAGDTVLMDGDRSTGRALDQGAVGPAWVFADRQCGAVGDGPVDRHVWSYVCAAGGECVAYGGFCSWKEAMVGCGRCGNGAAGSRTAVASGGRDHVGHGCAAAGESERAAGQRLGRHPVGPEDGEVCRPVGREYESIPAMERAHLHAVHCGYAGDWRAGGISGVSGCKRRA